MYWARSIIALLIVSVGICDCKTTPKNEARKFPDGFIFGASTASYQIEGAWNEDGKSENIWDHETHKVPSPIWDHSTGDIGADSYHQYERDVEMMRELGLDFYRFSMSWTRILPTSFPDKINEAGVAYYNNLINEMLKYNIEPMVTIYHWDLPQQLQLLGGWTNSQIVDWYADYARVLFETFGDRVKTWITINEPQGVCYYSYGSDDLAPRLNWTGIPEYMCTKNLLLAHAKAYHIYNDEYKPTQGGQIGITVSAQWYEPESPEQMIAAEEANQFDWGIYTHPIFSETGDYPAIVKETIAAKSKEQGYPRSRLPKLTPDEIAYIRVPSHSDDMGIITYQLPEWLIDDDALMLRIPWGFTKVLNKIKEYYNNPPVYITENGLASYGGLVDNDRIKFYRGYLDAMLDAIEDGCNIKAYSAWSIMDNFEWLRGYSIRFGLYEVDYESESRTRTPRKSAFVYKEILRTRTLDFNYDLDYEPYTTTMTIDEGH